MDVSDLSSTSKFDLFAQPFWLLGVDPTAPQQALRDAFDRTIQASSAIDLTWAYELLSNPSRRLLHELAYPLDCPSSGVDIYYAALSADAEIPDLLRFADQLWPLARANFLAHIAAHRPASGQLLYELVRSHAAIDSASIHHELETMRTLAGLPVPSLLNVNQNLAELRQLHAAAAFDSYRTVQDIAAPMLECTRQAIASDERHCTKALGRFLRLYRQATENVRAEVSNLIAGACTALLQRPDDSACIEAIGQTAQAWTSLCRPLLLWNVSQPKVQLKFRTPIAPLRSVIKELCADEQYDVAINVMTICQDIFAAVPTTIDQLSEDARLAKILSNHAYVGQLQDAIAHAEQDPEPLVAALETSGFDETSAEPAGNLWKSFVAAATGTPAFSPDQSPWRLIRDFAVRLSNRPNAAAAVIALLTGLIRLGERHGVPSRTLGELRDNLHFMQSFMGSDMAADSGAASSPSQGNIPRITKFSAAIARMIRPKLSSRSAWMVRVFGTGAAASLALGVFAIYFGPDLRLLWPARLSAATLQEATASVGTQTMPPVGTGQHLALEGVRYCNFQKERLRLIKQMIRRPEEARTYNLMIVDYNSRCSDFFYRDEDLELVDAEIKASKDILEADARQILSNVPGPNAELSAAK